jgi:hypothetical protein
LIGALGSLARLASKSLVANGVKDEKGQDLVPPPTCPDMDASVDHEVIFAKGNLNITVVASYNKLADTFTSTF